MFRENFSKMEDFQTFIDENGIDKPIEFKIKFPRIYDRFCRIIPTEKKNLLVYSNKLNSYKDIDTIEKLQKFIDDNNISRRKELHKVYPGLYVKFQKELDKVKFKESNLSLGEKLISDLLTENNIQFITQKTYQDFRNELPLRYDFYLTDYNVLIEHHGEEHFGIGRYYNKTLINNDRLKYEYAIRNNIPIIYYTIYKNIYNKYGYFTKVLTDSDLLLNEINKYK